MSTFFEGEKKTFELLQQPGYKYLTLFFSQRKIGHREIRNCSFCALLLRPLAASKGLPKRTLPSFFRRKLALTSQTSFRSLVFFKMLNFTDKKTPSAISFVKIPGTLIWGGKASKDHDSSPRGGAEGQVRLLPLGAPRQSAERQTPHRLPGTGPT